MVSLFLADGFEEIEALTTVDILRRAGIHVDTVGIGGNMIAGAHGIVVQTDLTDAQWCGDDLEAVILPGGMPGTKNLDVSSVVKKALAYAQEHDALLCAICAAPSVLGHMGYLMHKKATCFPGFEQELEGAYFQHKSVVVDGHIITANGAGAALDFAFEIVSRLASPEQAAAIRASMQCR